MDQARYGECITESLTGCRCAKNRPANAGPVAESGARTNGHQGFAGASVGVSVRIETLIDVKAALGEGPVWDVATQRSHWLDGVAGRIYRCDARGAKVQTWELPGRIGSIALRDRGWPSSP